MLMASSLPIQAAGSLIGAVGVSGSGKDKACAAAGLETVEERLEFEQ